MDVSFQHHIFFSTTKYNLCFPHVSLSFTSNAHNLILMQTLEV